MTSVVYRILACVYHARMNRRLRAETTRRCQHARRALVAGLLLAAALGPRTAAAEPPALEDLEPVTDRDYAIDFHQGPVLGSVRTVGMGGAAVALAEGSDGALINPAAVAVRRATAQRRWDWGWHAAWLNPSLAADYDNNGIDADNELEAAPILTAGLMGQYRHWGLGISYTSTRIPRTVQSPGGGERDILPQLEVVRVTLARSFADERVTVGLGFRRGEFSLDVRSAGESAPTRLFSLSGVSLEAGVVWRPKRANGRIGVALSQPVVVAEPENSACDPENCAGFILPDEVIVPWELTVGAAWRFGASRWHERTEARFRDERALIVAADLVVTGRAERGHGFEAFVAQRLQPAGREISTSVRVGAEYELLPGRLRVQLGSYLEPSRFAGVDSRVHLTAGVEWRFWQFTLWDKEYRPRLSLTGDFADRYGNAGVSIGFWH